jgi:hypothetical protein
MWRTVTVAPGSAALVSSVMNPEIDPVVPCAAAIAAAHVSVASTIPTLATTDDTDDAEEKTFLRVLCVPRGGELPLR